MMSFDELLRHWRTRAGLSGNALARAANIDASYLNRIERGEREPPRRGVVAELARALNLTSEEHDQLLLAAGHLPEALLRLGATDPTLRLVADILADEAIPAAERDAFRQIITLVAQRWRPTRDNQPRGETEPAG